MSEQVSGSAKTIRFTGEQLHEMWAESCLWSSVAYELSFDGLHPHRQAKWKALAEQVNQLISQI